MKNIDRKTVILNTLEKVSIEELIYRINNAVELDDAAIFIARLDSSYEDWDVTIKLVNHFDHLKETWLKDFPDEDNPFKPKKLC